MDSILELFCLVGLMLMCVPSTASLQCYMCPPTRRETEGDANLDCLALGWEMTCSSNQDRCFSSAVADDTQIKIEKGCARSQQCLGTTTCCQGNYCNADPQSSQTGHGKQCADMSNCIQGQPVMRCDVQSPGDLQKRCLCTDISFIEGAICRHKSSPGQPCRETHHCLDGNATCLSNVCTCADGMYANSTTCEPQKGLGELCLTNEECGGFNTFCTGIRCACEFGYLAMNATDSCSDALPSSQYSSLTLVTAGIFILVTTLP